jgi:hypothetical protein
LVQETILSLLPRSDFDLILTHGPRGEYTRHRRHEEVSRAVLALWAQGRLSTGELWMFAYEDGGRTYLPQPEAGANLVQPLPEELWQRKYRLIIELYGFAPDSWEARTTPRVEAFWRFDSPRAAEAWVATRRPPD